MNLNSPFFDRIRTKPVPDQLPKADAPRCDHPGCNAAADHRAPRGRSREGEYFCFCLEHVRQYNASYNYFAGMSDEAVARYQKDATIGHRPTWSMGVNRAAKGHREDGEPEGFTDPLGLFRNRARQTPHSEPKVPRYGRPTMRALEALNLEDSADGPAITARYKELVKRLHPDANGGDRSSEDKLREIIQAYKYLRTAGLV